RRWIWRLKAYLLCLLSYFDFIELTLKIKFGHCDRAIVPLAGKMPALPITRFNSQLPSIDWAKLL
ncbi:hypothetical protein C7B76_30485, partial [filamentous cyanobacterium CCP2]